MGGTSAPLPDCLSALAFQEEIRVETGCPLPFAADCPVGGRVGVRVVLGGEGGRHLEERLFSHGCRGWVEGHRGLTGDGGAGSEKTAVGSSAGGASWKSFYSFPF